MDDGLDSTQTSIELSKLVSEVKTQVTDEKINFEEQNFFTHVGVRPLHL